jgi:hypothetical protein
MVIGYYCNRYVFGNRKLRRGEEAGGRSLEEGWRRRGDMEEGGISQEARARGSRVD